jgi:ubiquinone/menaquinone biosynthesis C-methylase UbiE
MTSASDPYLLSDSASELERLRLQAKVWEPSAEAMLDQIGIKAGWSCVDLGCGALGILGPLSRRVGSAGRVVGVDVDAKQLAAARAHVLEQGLENVAVLERDAYRTTLPRESFDFTHVRFLFAPVGRDEELLTELLGLTRPGGIIAVQEPDASAWGYYPPSPEWERLKEAILAAFRSGGGDFDAGRRTYSMLRGVGLEDVQIRAAVVALAGRSPYKRVPLQFAASLRRRILEAEILKEAELDNLVRDCERLAADPETVMTSFVVTQVWGRKQNRQTDDGAR